MNRAFLIIVVPAALVVMGYFLALRHSGITLPIGELIVPVVVLLAAATWLILKKKKRRGKDLKTQEPK